MITRVTEENQVTVPAEVAAKAGIEPGTARAELHGARSRTEIRVLKSVAEVAADVRGRGARYRNRPDSAVDALLREREQDERVSGLERLS